MHIPRVFTLFLVVILATALLGGCSSAAPTRSSQTQGMAMADMPSYMQSAPATVQEAYQFAVTNPHALETVPCYCGCGKMGHKSNLHCYIKDRDANSKITFDDHASYCGVCVDITQVVIRMQKEGKSPHEIRTAVDAQFSSFGPSTDTPLPAA